ncbi:hypothetical protein J2Z34_000823 [Youngiibacter multivorans]|uniref:Uncharacterized protein n=1 Tax=Youngiibacter multivorans TaxID=937251 RepID=A0ABS4G1H0_9CLOT|nr:hypothetical protein [Youngiibacter multivorans]
MKARNKPEDHFPARVAGNRVNFMVTPHAFNLYRQQLLSLLIQHCP